MRGLVVAIVALLALSGCGGGEAGADPDPSPTAAPPLTEAVLLTAEEVPTRERLTAWREEEPSSAAALACQARPLDALGAETVVRRRFVANIAGFPEGDPSSAVDLAVLQYADPAAAEAARREAAAEVHACSPTLDELGEPIPGKGSHEVIGGGGTLLWQQRDFLATDVCSDDCDAVRFHRMGAGVVGSRVVLVSLAEVGGPLQPSGLDPTMEALAAAALERAGS